MSLFETPFFAVIPPFFPGFRDPLLDRRKPTKPTKRKYRYMPSVVSYERKLYGKIRKGEVYAPTRIRVIPKQYRGLLERAEKIKYVYRRKKRKRR